MNPVQTKKYTHRLTGWLSPAGVVLCAALLNVALVALTVANPGLAMASQAVAVGAGANGNSGTADASKPGTRIYKYLKGGTTSFSDVPPSKLPYVVFSPSCYACNVNVAIIYEEDDDAAENDEQ